jgi:glyoxylase-like metal-dependent hydrolase (beta-lactamase superfamily II)
MINNYNSHKKYFSIDGVCIINVGEAPGGDGFLIITEGKTALLEAGFSFCANEMIENIKAELKGRPLDYVLLTHSHYDHASGCAYIKRAFKDVKIVSSAYCAKILAKPSAVEVMREMNLSAAGFFGYESFEDRLEPIEVDITLSDGETLDLGGLTVVALEAPGHTKCCLSYWIPEKKLLLSCETLGCLTGRGQAAPCYLVGYDISISYIKRIMELKPDYLHVPHYGVLAGEEAESFIQAALDAAIALKDLIVSDHKKGMTYDEILAHYKQVFYNEELRGIQPQRAFDLNASYMIPMIIRDCMV